MTAGCTGGDDRVPDFAGAEINAAIDAKTQRKQRPQHARSYGSHQRKMRCNAFGKSGAPYWI